MEAKEIYEKFGDIEADNNTIISGLNFMKAVEKEFGSNAPQSLRLILKKRVQEMHDLAKDNKDRINEIWTTLIEEDKL